MYGNAASTLSYLLTKLVLFGPPLRESYIGIIYTCGMVGKLVFEPRFTRYKWRGGVVVSKSLNTEHTKQGRVSDRGVSGGGVPAAAQRV